MGKWGEKLKEWHRQRQIQDMQETLCLLRKGGPYAKIISIFCFWYPFRGSVEKHIEYLECKISEA